MGHIAHQMLSYHLKLPYDTLHVVHDHKRKEQSIVSMIVRLVFSFFRRTLEDERDMEAEP